MHPVRPKVLVDLDELFLGDDHAAHAGAHHHADPARVGEGHREAGVVERLLGRHEGELRVAIQPFRVRDRELGGIEVGHLASHLRAVDVHRDVEVLEALDDRDARPASQRILPERVDADPDRRDHAEAGDDHSSHGMLRFRSSS